MASDHRLHPTPTRRRATRRPLALGLVIGVVTGAALVSAGFFAVPRLRDSSCTANHDAPLRIVAVPELAPVVNAVLGADAANPAGQCARAVSVISQPADVTAANLAAERDDRPDVWIADSSVWTERATEPGRGVPSDNPSVASSPAVVAVARAVAQRRAGHGVLRIDQLIPDPSGDDNPVPWVMPDPEQSAATVAALVDLKSAVAGEPAAAARFGAVIRAANRNVVGLDRASSSRSAIPATEQQLYAHNVADPQDKLVGAYAASPFRFDYPFIVLTGDRALRAQAATVLTELQSSLGRQLLAAAGFRGTEGAATPAIIDAVGPEAARARVAGVADADVVRAAIGTYRSITQPSRLLALLDVSGSMATPVPGTHGATRLDLAVRASVTGLAVYPDDTVVGVWEFSTNLTPKTDYKVIAPLQQLGRGADGTTGRQRIAAGLAGVHVMHGRTGLNDTILAGIREVRRDWDPHRVNSVVVITDGGDSDRKGISTGALLRTLAAENDPKRPVALYAIAYGPSGDFANLQKLAAVTSGRAYAAPDPRDIGKVLADAIGHRTCVPNC